MLNFAPTLGINSHRLGRQESLAISSRLSLNRMSALPALGLMRSAPLALNAPLVRTSKFLSTRIDRSHIGWDTWNPLDYPHDSSLDIESFNEGIDRHESGSNRVDSETLLTDERQSNNFSNSDNGEPNFFAKILTNESYSDAGYDELAIADRSTSDVPISPKASRSKSKSPAKSKPEKVPTKAKSKTSKLPAKAKPSEILPETIDSLKERAFRQRIQPAIIPDSPVVNILAANDSIEPTSSESIPDIVTTFIDSSNDPIDPLVSIESFVVRGKPAPLENRAQTSPPSDNLEIADALDLIPENRLLPDNLSPTLPTPPQIDRVQKSTPNIETNPEVIASIDPDSRLLDPVRLPDVDAPAVSAATPLPSIQPAFTAFPTTEPEITTTISESPLLFPDPLSPPPANDIAETAANESGIDKTIAPASSPQLLLDTYSTTLLPVPVDTDATVTNTEPGIDKTTVLESPAIVTDIFPATSTLAQVEPTSLRSNEPEIATKITTEAIAPVSSESLPTPTLPSPITVNDNANIPAASDTVLPDIFSATSTPPPSVESNSIPLNEIERETATTPEFTTLFISDSFPTFLSPSLAAATELTPDDNDEPEIDNLTIQTNPDAIPPDILPNISTQILPSEPNSTIANEPESVITTPEFAAQLLPNNLPISPIQSSDLDVENISIDRDLTGIEQTIIPELSETVFTDISTPISPVTQNLIATSNLEIALTTSPEPSQDSQQLNAPSILPVETLLLPDNIDIDRAAMPVSIDPTASADIISPAVSNEVTDFTNLAANQELETLPDNIQIDRDTSVNAIELNIDRQLDLDEPILPNNNLIKPALNIEPQPEIEQLVPVRGYATGGYVKAADKAKEESIASSDTVAAMLTPGEFVINAKDAQENLNLLTHLNSGGKAETIARSLAPELSTQNLLTAPTTPLTKPTASIHESLISRSLQPDLDRHQISFLNRSPLDNTETSQTNLDRFVPNYISPSLIFRKPQSANRSDFSRFDPPDEWNSIEELMNGGSYGAEPFSFSSDGAQNLNNDRSSISSSQPDLSPKYSSPILGFANGGEVPLPDLAPKIEPITQTIEAAVPDEGGSKNSDSAELETLAREIYCRLRQRLEIERERQGIYSGNLAW